jgi:hypothetical protein
MKKSKALALLACILVLGFITVPLRGQNAPVRTYEVFQPTSAYYAAMELVHQSDAEREQGITALLSLAQQNPGTTLGAKCLFTAAAYEETKQASTVLYQRIVAEYPHSGFELKARLAILCLQTQTTDAWLSATDSLLNSYNAPTLAEVVVNQGQAVTKLRSLPLDYQHGLIDVYTQILGVLQSPNIHRYSEAVRLGQFGREAFYYDRSGTAIFGAGAFNNLVNYRANYTGPSQPRVPAKITVRSPRGGKVGPLPKIRIETTLRGSRSIPVSPEHSQFLLDGVDVSSQVRVLSNRLNLDAKKNQVFEQLLFGYQPVQLLSPGRHQFSMIIPTELDQINPIITGPGVARKTINFEVRNGERDCDDEKDDEHWEDND